LLQVPAGLREDQLVAALQAVLDHHDALRLRVVAPAPGNDSLLEVLPAGAVEAKSRMRRIDIRGLDAEARRACIAQEAQAAPARLAPATAGVMQAVWVGAGAGEPRRLLLTMQSHALV